MDLHKKKLEIFDKKQINYEYLKAKKVKKTKHRNLDL